MQAGNLPDVVWPNKFYHPYEPDGFSMAAFLDANTRPPREYPPCGPRGPASQLASPFCWQSSIHHSMGTFPIVLTF